MLGLSRIQTSFAQFHDLQFSVNFVNAEILSNHESQISINIMKLISGDSRNNSVPALAG